LQDVRRAARTGRPTDDGWVVAEGPHLLDEALCGEWPIQQVFATTLGKRQHEKLLSRVEAEVVEVSQRAFESLAGTESTQGIMAALLPRSWTWNEVLGGRTLLVVLDGVQDPGNAGTLMRSAEAFGATGIVYLAGSVRISNGKLLRAAAGSAFRIPFLQEVSRTELIQQLHEKEILPYSLSANGSVSLLKADLMCPLALITGGEGGGISAEVAAQTQMLSIPALKVESLNAAVACSIALFEAARQRRLI